MDSINLQNHENLGVIFLSPTWAEGCSPLSGPFSNLALVWKVHLSLAYLRLLQPMTAVSPPSRTPFFPAVIPSLNLWRPPPHSCRSRGWVLVMPPGSLHPSGRRHSSPTATYDERARLSCMHTERRAGNCGAGLHFLSVKHLFKLTWVHGEKRHAAPSHYR